MDRAVTVNTARTVTSVVSLLGIPGESQFLASLCSIAPSLLAVSAVHRVEQAPGKKPEMQGSSSVIKTPDTARGERHWAGTPAVP